MIMMFAKLIGRKETANQLYNNLQLDITKTMNEMDWTPKYSLEKGIELSLIMKHNKSIQAFKQINDLDIL